MRFILALAAFLCLTIWKSAVHATYGPASDCCLDLRNTRIELSKVSSYTVQNKDGRCPIKAIKIFTKGNKTLCSDPEHGWTKRAMRKVDMETKALLPTGQTEGETTIQITPAVSAPMKTSPKPSPKLSPKPSPKPSPKRNVTKRKIRHRKKRKSAITKWQRSRV